jgi:hypothetical protein
VNSRLASGDACTPTQAGAKPFSADPSQPGPLHTTAEPAEILQMRRSVSVAVVALSVAGAIMTAGSTAASAAGTTATPLACGGTHAFSSIPVKTPRRGGYLSSVVAASATKAWAVGTDSYATQTYITSLREGAFRVADSPMLPREVSLNAVAMLGPHPIAVGTTGYVPSASRAIALERIDGSWVRMNTSVLDKFHRATLTDIAVGPSGHAWTVGAVSRVTRWVPAVIRWNGRRWTRVQVPYPAAGATLASVAVADGEVWAAGTDSVGGYVLHLTAGRWNYTNVEIPAGWQLTQINGVAAPAADNVWITGLFADEYNAPHPLIERWNGSSWTIVPGPADAPDALLLDVAVGAAHSLLSVGWELGGNDASVAIAGSSTGGPLSSVDPGGLPYTTFGGVSFVRGTDTAFIVGGADGVPLAYRNCA